MNYMQGAPNKTSETIEITYCENLNALALSWTQRCVKYWQVHILNIDLLRN
jgi:hypothetical protein